MLRCAVLCAPSTAAAESAAARPNHHTLAGMPVLERRRIARDWIDVDAMNHDDPQSCSHYAQAIFDHLREAEVSAFSGSRGALACGA
jgi:hypothetical protein